MPYFMYVALQEDDQISVLEIDAQTGKLTHQTEVSIPGGPSSLAISPGPEVSLRRLPRHSSDCQLRD